MKSFIIFIFAIASVAGALAAHHGKEPPIVRLTYKPAFPYSEIPTLEIYADGFVWFKTNMDMSRRSELDPPKISALVSAVNKLGFYRITTRSVDESMHTTTVRTTLKGAEATAERVIITDCETAKVSIRRDRKIHIVSGYCVEEMVKYYPKAVDLIILNKTIDKIYAAAGKL